MQILENETWRRLLALICSNRPGVQGDGGWGPGAQTFVRGQWSPRMRLDPQEGLLAHDRSHQAAELLGQARTGQQTRAPGAATQSISQKPPHPDTDREGQPEGTHVQVLAGAQVQASGSRPAHPPGSRPRMGQAAAAQG